MAAEIRRIPQNSPYIVRLYADDSASSRSFAAFGACFLLARMVQVLSEFFGLPSRV